MMNKTRDMKVYGIYSGIKHEGGNVGRVLYKSYAKAKKEVHDEIEINTIDDWPLSEFKKIDGKDMWSNGINIVAIQKFTIK